MKCCSRKYIKPRKLIRSSTQALSSDGGVLLHVSDSASRHAHSIGSKFHIISQRWFMGPLPVVYILGIDMDYPGQTDVLRTSLHIIASADCKVPL